MNPSPEWPRDADAVVDWIRTVALEPGEEVIATGLERIRVTAELIGTDLESLAIDATDAALDLHFADPSPAPMPAVEPDVVRSSTGIARSVRMTAQPMRISGIPLFLDVRLSDAPITWLVYANPTVRGTEQSRHDLQVAEDGTGVRGSVDLSIRADDIAPLIRSMLEPGLASAGIRLRRLDIDILQDGADGIRLRARGAARWKLLSASARASARVRITSDGILTLRDLRIGSGNPVVAFGLLFVRRHLRDAIGNTFDLNADEAGLQGIRVHGVQVAADEDVRIRARLGRAPS
ncbi:hypothetical protein OED01_01140 [Microbacterium sp. M28]|uniref:hypothetical protein n=1 Tax=Microbacterium sp. M28 TaxID=2962064 RepID=UPI0021F4BE9B|nr:hypothetical protein [Microbacterium sp. M28]UYO97364.1 hypothetical protein OED01_01140 [Microbacterium sp. M28]